MESDERLFIFFNSSTVNLCREAIFQSESPVLTVYCSVAASALPVAMHVARAKVAITEKTFFFTHISPS